MEKLVERQHLNSYIFVPSSVPPAITTIHLSSYAISRRHHPPKRLYVLQDEETPNASKRSDGGMDPSCRILTISATIDGAETFIEQIKNISTTSPSPTGVSTTTAPQAVSSDVAALAHTPWTITNRYYTADVHFALLRMEAVTSSIFLAGMNRRPPPAIVYVWREGEAYSDHIAELSRIMASESYEPEVSLAVRIPAPKSDAEPSTSLARKNDDAEDDGTNGDIDNTLMSYGFEYIDGTQSLEASTSTSGPESLDDVPGLPRVLDALSTIMWPSMKSATKGGSSSSKGLLDEKSRREHDDIMEELLSQGRDASFSSTQSDSETKEREAKESEDEDADLLAQMHAFVRKGNGTVPSVGVDGTPFSPYDFNNTEGKQRPCNNAFWEPWTDRSRRCKLRREGEASVARVRRRLHRLRLCASRTEATRA
ncbi:hypothetical protein NLJ89_g11858 [Agrocybe chaxingu]|uniref:Uncharacterized protein n=1 Tax=Agrocybe chaxingu TaxID=84603 RepID=A0A9W8JVZ5_9AGAR|nr:hypothetical protein NLJ89_g11858 [Agrocybe chaxingu]